MCLLFVMWISVRWPPVGGTVPAAPNFKKIYILERWWNFPGMGRELSVCIMGHEKRRDCRNIFGGFYYVF